MVRTTPILLSALLLTAVAAPALAYVGGGTLVVTTPDQTLLDNGGVVCQGATGEGVGGGCLPFPAIPPREGVFIGVMDENVGREVAFQVCIDNNGDGICGGPQRNPRCFDQIFFSHADGGRFHNALGPLPTSFLEGCGAGGFPGYVVLLCTGEHADPELGPHAHGVTRGTIAFTNKGTGYGDFCGGGGSGGAAGGNNAAVAKAYRVV